MKIVEYNSNNKNKELLTFSDVQYQFKIHMSILKCALCQKQISINDIKSVETYSDPGHSLQRHKIVPLKIRFNTVFHMSLYEITIFNDLDRLNV